MGYIFDRIPDLLLCSLDQRLYLSRQTGYEFFNQVGQVGLEQCHRQAKETKGWPWYLLGAVPGTFITVE